MPPAPAKPKPKPKPKPEPKQKPKPKPRAPEHKPEHKPEPKKPEPKPAKPTVKAASDPAPPPPLGPRTGKLIAALPVDDLTKPGAGAWNSKAVNLKKSKIVDFKSERAIQVYFPKRSGAPDGSNDGGIQFDFHPKGLPTDAAVLVWRMYVPEGFDFARGGKLLGFQIGRGEASGGKHSATAASSRVMFQGSVGSSTAGGTIAYNYAPSGVPQVEPGLDADGYGSGFFHKEFAGALTPGSWHVVELGIKMNTFTNGKPNADGVSYLCIDGKACELTRVRWSKDPEHAVISGISCNLFFGGPSPSPKNQAFHLSGFEVHEFVST